MAESSDPSLQGISRRAALDAGRAPVGFFAPRADAPTAVVIVDEVEQGWRDYGPDLLHDAKVYGAWPSAAGNTTAADGSTATTLDEMRDNPGGIVDVPGAKELSGGVRHGELDAVLRGSTFASGPAGFRAGQRRDRRRERTPVEWKLKPVQYDFGRPRTWVPM